MSLPISRSVKRTTSVASAASDGEDEGLLPRVVAQRGRPYRFANAYTNTNTLSRQTGGGGTAQTTVDAPHSWLWTFLLVGLVFTMIDTAYIVRFVLNHHAHEPHDDPKAQQLHKLQLLHNSQQQQFTDSTARQQHDSKESLRILKIIQNEPDRIPILQLLQDAQVDMTMIDPIKLAQLPKWSDIAALYGSEPVFVGLDTCRTFQESPNPAEHFVSTAGTFNTGTNLMAELLIANCQMPARVLKYGRKQRGVRWQVLWGKRTYKTCDEMCIP
jgi:hypothetical protein